jgi:hypothetical protein
MTTRTRISQPWPETGLDGGMSPEASQRVTVPSGVAKSEAERPLALPPTRAMETWPMGPGGLPPTLIWATVTCQRPSPLSPVG